MTVRFARMGQRRGRVVGAILVVLTTIAVAPTSSGAAAPRIGGSLATAACPRALVPPAGFDDLEGVADRHAIDCLVWWELASGVDDSRFDPGGPITRGELAAVLARLLDRTGDAPEPGPNTITDIQGDPHAVDIAVLATARVVTRRGAFRPTDPITRAEMSRFVDRLLSAVYGQELPATTVVFTDVPATHPHAEAIGRLVGGRIAVPTSETTFSPDVGATRSEVAVFVTRAAGRLVRQELAQVPVRITPPSPCTVPAPRTAVGYQALFDGTWGDEWAASDGAHTIPLPDGRSMWTWGDTLQGRPDEEAGGWEADPRVIANSVLVQDQGCLTAVLGVELTDTIPKPVEEGEWYWPTNGILIGDRIYVHVHHLRFTDHALFPFEVIGGAIAVFDAPGIGEQPAFLSVIPSPSSDWDARTPNVSWGVGMWADGEHVYLYGILHPTWTLGNELHVARVPVGEIEDLGAWRYRTETGWSANPLDSVNRIAGDAHTIEVMSFGPWGSGLVFVSKKNGYYGEEGVKTWTSPTFDGPFTEAERLTLPADNDERYTYYTANQHPQLALASGKVLASISRNSPDPSAISEEPTLYKPQFTEETITPPGSAAVPLAAEVTVAPAPLRTPTTVDVLVTAAGTPAYGRPVTIRSRGELVARAHTDAYGIARMPIASLPVRLRVTARAGVGQIDAVRQIDVVPVEP